MSTATEQQTQQAVLAIIKKVEERLKQKGWELPQEGLDNDANTAILLSHFQKSKKAFSEESLEEAIIANRDRLAWTRRPKQKIDLGQTASWGQDPRKNPDAGKAAGEIREKLLSDKEKTIRRSIESEISTYVAYRGQRLDHAQTENRRESLRSLAAQYKDATKALAAVKEAIQKLPD